MAYVMIHNGKDQLGWVRLAGSMTVGRQAECDICVSDELLSRVHCRIEEVEQGGQGWMVMDLGSRNGTWRAGRPVERLVLAPGMQVRCGRTTLTYCAGDPPREGRYIRRSSHRPADPHEALAATVMGMCVVGATVETRPADPWAALSARSIARPVPRPQPLQPTEAEAAIALLEAPAALGILSLGTVSPGTVSPGTVSPGTVSLGTVSLGTMSLRELPRRRRMMRQLPQPILVSISDGPGSSSGPAQQQLTSGLCPHSPVLSENLLPGSPGGAGCSIPCLPQAAGALGVPAPAQPVVNADRQFLFWMSCAAIWIAVTIILPALALSLSGR